MRDRKSSHPKLSPDLLYGDKKILWRTFRFSWALAIPDYAWILEVFNTTTPVPSLKGLGNDWFRSADANRTKTMADAHRPKKNASG
jgi:hypothetical protein